MSLGNVRISFSGLQAADAGRLAAELEAAFDADITGATATRVRTDPNHQDLGMGLLIAFMAEAAVIAAFKLIEKRMERAAKEARLTIEIGELTPALALAIAKDVDRKYWSEGLTTEVEKHLNAST